MKRINIKFKLILLIVSLVSFSVKTYSQIDTLLLNLKFEKVNKSEKNYAFYLLYKQESNKKLYETKLYSAENYLLEEGKMLSIQPLIRNGKFKIYDKKGNIKEIKEYSQDTLKRIQF